ncbi:MAG: DinB family protein [Actinomycetota bacterium]|nr:DinB family protein [Actinomycetota bacterium]
MPENTDELPGREFVHVDLTGALFRRARLNDARFRMVDLSGAVMRDVSLSGATIDGEEIDGLLINGVEVAPLIEAELRRREPVRALLRAPDPAGLRAAWAALEQSWAATYDRVAALPAGTVDVSVEEEWSFAYTLRHLIFATDGWLGAILGEQRPFHPWGMPFTGVGEFVDRPEDLVDLDATPSYAEVLDLRADRVAKVREFLAEVTPDRLAEECEGPLWEGGRHLSVLRCLWVILNEECEHRRYAERDLDLIEAGLVAAE